jgi:tRNA-Thr(GGU) m(6)t(6)A37 methyltransferase TsaA
VKNIVLHSIGKVSSTRKVVEDDNWDQETVFVELDPTQFSEEALVGLQDFSHVEVLFFMDQVDPMKVEKMARHPRNNLDWPKVGIFAQRGKNRPNQIGATICRIVKVEGLSLYIEGLDAVHGTPVLDLKPWVLEFAPRGDVHQPQWITELMQGYWKKNDL